MNVKGYPEHIPLPKLLIPEWMINPTPDAKIALRQFCTLTDWNNIPAYFRRMDEIVYEVSEEMFYYP